MNFDRYDRKVFDRSFFPGGGAEPKVQSIFEAAEPPSQSLEDFSGQQMRSTRSVIWRGNLRHCVNCGFKTSTFGWIKARRRAG